MNYKDINIHLDRVSAIEAKPRELRIFLNGLVAVVTGSDRELSELQYKIMNPQTDEKWMQIAWEHFSTAQILEIKELEEWNTSDT